MLIKKKKTVKEIVVPVTKAAAPAVSSNSGFNFHNPITQEIENQAKSLVQKKSEELLEEFNKEIAVKKNYAEQEIQQMLQEAHHEAEKIIEEAVSYKKSAEIEIYDAKKLLENERNDIAILKDQELKQSFEEGMSKASEIVSELVNYLATFHEAKKKIIEESKQEIMSIAFDLAKQILGYEVQTNDDVLFSQVERAISKVVTAKGIMQIYLNPKDIDKVEPLEKALLKILDPSVKLVFQKDESIDQGSCIVNTQGGRLDASFTGQINVLKQVLERYLGYEIKALVEPEIQHEIKTEIKTEIEQVNIPANKPINQYLEQSLDDFDDVEMGPLDDFDFENLSLEDYLLKHGENVDNNIIDNIDLEDETMSILELESQDSKELGANDFSDQELELSLSGDDEDEDFDDFEDDEDEEEDDDLEDDEDLDDEDDDEEEDDDDDFEDDEDLEEYDENPDDDDDKGDDRFPEY